jgi:hypothetical protein
VEPSEKENTQMGLLDRFRKSWFPPAAVVGAFAAFVGAAFRVRHSPPAIPPKSTPPGTPRPVILPIHSAPPAGSFEREYSRSLVLGSAASAHPFRRTLAGIAVGSGDKICALGDDEVRIFEPDGSFLRGWKIPEDVACLAVGPDGRVYLGSLGRVGIYDSAGSRAGGFAAGEQAKPAKVTSIKVVRNEILIADSAVRFIRRCDLSGKLLGEIGTQNNTKGFMLPNGWLDFDVDFKGVIRATDTGRHQVTAWALDGSPLGSFGKFGMSNPADFVGCCNPVNIALTPDGKIVTAEKMVARVKVYESDGKLLAVIGPEHFDPACTHIYLAVDSKGRILAADPVRREVKIFSLVAKSGVSDPPDDHHLPIRAKTVELECV